MSSPAQKPPQTKGGEGLCGCTDCFCMYYADCECDCCECGRYDDEEGFDDLDGDVDSG